MKNVLTFLITMILLPMFAFGQQGMFQYTEERAANLTINQIELLETLQAKPQVVNTWLVTAAGISDMESKEQLFFNLPDEKILTVQRTSVETVKENQFRWTGDIGEAVSEVHLLIAKEGLTGMLRSKNNNYDIYPLRDSGFHVLVEIDPSKFEKESPPLILKEISKTKGNGQDNSDQDAFKMMTDPEIRVFVVYTTNAKNNHPGSMGSLITLAEGYMNDAFNNSGVNADITVVHTAEISYNESVDDDLNLCRLTMSQTFDPRTDPISTTCDGYSNGEISGYLDQIHDWRYQYDANLVVLITGPNTGTGIGWMPAYTNYAFSIARYDVAASGYTMAHEIGHNLGAAHNLAEDDPEVYSYGHGYVYDPAEWATIMSYEPTGYTTINHYSNPDKTFAGVATGTVEDEDNARAINNKVGLTANFTPPTPPPTVAVSGPSSMQAGSSDIFSAQVSGYTFPYSYQWYYKNDNDFMWTTAFGESSSNYEHTAGSPPGETVRVKVVDDHSNTVYSSHHFYINTAKIIPGVQELPEDFALQQNYPNPFNPSTQIIYELPEEADVTIEVYNIMGKKVTNLVNARMSAGYHEVQFDGSNLSSGLYITRIEAIGTSGEQFSKGLKMQLIK